MSGRAWVRRGLPFAVSVLALFFLFRQIDFAEVVGAVSWRVARILVPALLAYGAVTLVLEAISLRRLLHPAPESFSAWTAAQIKCASYLLAIVNYTLGAAALAVLLRRRAGARLADAAAIVALVSSTDLLVVLFTLAMASAYLGTGSPATYAAVVSLLALGFFGGLTLLRTPRSLGPLERVRSLAIFDALRTLPLARLAELLVLRILFVAAFVGVCMSAFAAFEVWPPFGLLIAGILIIAVVGALPIAVAGLGTVQVAMLRIFEGEADPATLLAMSLVLSAGMVSLRGLMGFVFAREFTREALAETRGEPA